jgi:ribonuclease T1
VNWLAVAVLAVGLAQDIPADELPREARETLALIRAGGPFPYPQDGKTFQNREKLLPPRSRGYYREYTVKTPGARDRGARRIVAGNGGEFYYTADHYRSFQRIIE